MVGRERPRAPPPPGPPPGAPFTKAPAAAGAAGPSPARVYLTIRNLAQVATRRKPLPPDANADATPCQLLQLEEHAEYRCTRCRKDGIVDDVLAVDATSGVMMCAQCYARAVRPKQYRPTRMVPFPSLLAWLHYRPADAQTSVSDDVMARPAEAVAPSGSRALGVESALSAPPRSAADLASTPLNPAGVGRLDAASRLAIEGSAAGREALGGDGGGGPAHPCPRVFGRCSHGATCFFLRAPRTQSLGFLMGIVPARSAAEERGPASQTEFLSLRAGASGAGAAAGPEADERQDSVFGLPDAGDPAPPRTWAARDEFAAWVGRRRRSANEAEWQLWNQEGTARYVDAVLPPPRAPEVPAAASDGASGGGGGGEAKPKIAALRGVLAKLRGQQSVAAEESASRE